MADAFNHTPDALIVETKAPNNETKVLNNKIALPVSNLHTGRAINRFEISFTYFGSVVGSLLFLLYPGKRDFRSS